MLVEREYDFDGVVPTDVVAQVIVDALFAAGLSHNRAALAEQVPVYAYETCDVNAPPSHVEPALSALRCAHDSDLPLLFQWDDFHGKPPQLSTKQLAMAVAMGRYWGNFAATGDPNSNELPVWPVDSPEVPVVQLIRPADQGGIRTSEPGAYEREHRIAFRSRLAKLKRPKTYVPWIGGALVLIALFFWTFWRRRATAKWHPKAWH